MMRTRVLSKLKFDEILPRMGITNDTVGNFDAAFISISNPDSAHTAYFDGNRKNVLNLVFDDATDEENQRLSTLGLTELQLFTRKQAQEIIDFMEVNRDRETVYVHCSAGRSRSGAVGTFINDVWGRQTFQEFINSNPTVSPNYYVLALLRRVYNNIEDGN
jgi:predicted protein tyrosine phosphatase